MVRDSETLASKYEMPEIEPIPTARVAESQEIPRWSEKETLHRNLKPRHLSMIAIGGSVGTGLIIGSGTVLATAGPGSLLISFVLVGLNVYLVMTAVGEMASYLPQQSGFAGYAERFVDPALGFSLGWCYLLKYIFTSPNQLTAAALVIQEWLPAERVNPGVWIAIFLVLIALINYFGIGIFGEVEYWLSMVKVLAFIGLIILCFVLTLGGGPDHDRKGFRYWNDPGAFRTYKNMPEGPTGKFVAFWSSMITAAFAYLGTELVGVTAGEARNPEKSIPRATKLTFYRIAGFYILSVFFLGMVLPYNSPELVFSLNAKTGASASPFTAAIRVAGIKVLPSILNACILLFVIGTANSDLYIVSRTIYGLSKRGYAPRIFQYTNERGVPLAGIGLGCLGCCLGFLNISSSSRLVFRYLVNLVTIFGMITWACILITHIQFKRGLKKQKIESSRLPYNAPLGLYGSCVSLAFTILIIFTKNFTVFIPSPSTYGNFNHIDFITGYIGIPVFCILFVGFKIIKKTNLVVLEEMDLTSNATI